METDDTEEDIPVRMGSPETWKQYVDRVQRAVHESAQVFVGKQVGTDGDGPICTFIVVPGKPRQDLVDEIFIARKK